MSKTALGTVTISPVAVRTVVSLTTLSVPGVVSMSSDFMSGLREIARRRRPIHGVHVDMSHGVVVDVHIAAESGTSLSDLGERVQRAVTEAAERLLGLSPSAVNVFVDEMR